MIDIEVVNIAVTKMNRDTSRKVTYCGRPGDLGNPYVMKDESERDEVCDMYHDYFYMLSQGSDRFQEILDGLVKTYHQQGYLRLGCFCKPKRCHVETIAEYLRQRLQEQLCLTNK